MTNDSTPLDAGISVVSLGILSADNPSASVDAIAGLGAINNVLTGSILGYGGATTPAGYLTCDGGAYDGTNATYTPLWNVIGTTYGGTGQSSFRVPNLTGRAPIGFGQGSTEEGGQLGTAWSLGQLAGTESHTLTIPQMPSHSHQAGGALSAPSSPQDQFVRAIDGLGNATSTDGGGGPHNNLSPVSVIHWIIKL